MKGKYILVSISILFMLLLSVNISVIKNFCYKIFRLDGKYFTLNTQGKINGEAIEYIDGNVRIKEHFINGVRQGWSYEYYGNGKLKRKTQFLKGEANNEFLFDETGRLVQSRNYLRNKPYGNWLTYDTLGNLVKYSLIDIAQNMTFSSKIDRSGNLQEMKGFVVSPNFYSFDIDQKTICLNKGTVYLNTGVKDFFMTVVNVPNYRLLLSININGDSYFFDNIKNNTIKISNVFITNGKYKIDIKSKLINKRNEVVNGININDEIVIR